LALKLYIFIDIENLKGPRINSNLNNPN